MAGFTPQQLAALEASIALGVLSMEHQGKKTTFQSLSAMLDLRDRMKSEIQAANAAPGASIPCMTRPTYYRRG